MVAFEQDECVIKEVRRHWFFILLSAVSNLAAAFIPLALFVGLSFLGDNPTILVLRSYMIILTPLWILIVWMSFFYFWTEYYLDVLIITNKRIIDIDQKSLFDRDTSTFPLENIQDITIHIGGILATLLRFGNIDVQTAGENAGFTINDAAEPDAVKQIITAEHDKALERMRNKVL